MKIKISILFLLLLLAAPFMNSPNAEKVKINEVLVNNQDGYVDEYGQKVPWIELFNNSFNNANIEGCYLSIDINNPKMYKIPKGDIATDIEKRQHVIFFADGKEQRGTFHTNFTLNPDTENTVFFFDANGKNLIDSVTIPVIAADQSWGRPVDGGSEWKLMTRVTPKANNMTLDKNIKADKFADQDKFGIGMSITAMGVVFMVLILLYVFFKVFTRVSVKLSARRVAKINGEEVKNMIMKEDTGEIHAAISMALYELGNDAHDIENMVLTISRTRRTYSPWSSKIYGLRQTPDKK